MRSVIMLNAVKLTNVIKAIMLSVIMLNVAMLSAIASIWKLNYVAFHFFLKIRFLQDMRR
jgi:hypothetical protein